MPIPILDEARILLGLIRVGRWMSPEEHEAMLKTGMIQRNITGLEQVSVTHPPNILSFMSQAEPGSRYVEFDVPENSLRPGGRTDWKVIPGPKSIHSRVNLRRGLPPFEYPPAYNIQWIASKVGPR